MNSKSLVDIEAINAVEFSVDDESNPRSVVSLTSGAPAFQTALKRLLLESPELLDLEFHEIQQKANPTFTLSRIRMAFWNEYEMANQSNRQMHMSKIIAGVCTDRLFRAKVLGDNVKLAYILSPPKDYQITVKEALDASLDNLRAIACAKVVNEKGELIPKAADVALKAIALLDMRVKGAVVQRIDQRSLNVNVNKDVSPDSSKPQSVEDLERELAQIKQRIVKDISQARLPSAPEDLLETMKEANVELVDVGGSYKLKNE